MTAAQYVLVTGGAGFIGSHCCKALASAGHVPVTYDNLVYGHRDAVRWGPFVKGDVRDQERLLGAIREFNITAVMHFAAYAYVGESIRDPQKYFQNNLVNALALFDTMLRADVKRIVFSSTCATYGVPNVVPINEDAPQNPVNPYGETKLMIERALHWYGNAYGLRSCSLRYFNAAGADPEGEIGECHDPETHLIPLVLDSALGRRAVVDVYGTDYPTPDGTAIRDYVHVQDIAHAHVKAMDYLEAGGESARVNLGTGQGHSVLDVLATAEQVVGRPIPRRFVGRRPGDPPELVADPSYANRLLGWHPRISDLNIIIQTAWSWHVAAGRN